MTNFRKDIGIISTSILLLFSILLAIYSKHNSKIIGLSSYVVNLVINPLELTLDFTTDKLSNVWTNYIKLIGTNKENQLLKTENEKLTYQLAELSEILEENKQLKSLLELKPENIKKTIVAKVIGYDPSSWVEQIIIDKGAFDGINQGQVVISTSGLVGQIISVGANSSVVQLISDRRSSVDSTVIRTRVRGIIDGNGFFTTKWNYVPKDSDVVEGDLVITSGLDEIYPEGILIGKVKKVERNRLGDLFKKIEVELEVDFRKLEYLMVISNE